MFLRHLPLFYVHSFNLCGFVKQHFVSYSKLTILGLDLLCHRITFLLQIYNTLFELLKQVLRWERLVRVFLVQVLRDTAEELVKLLLELNCTSLLLHLTCLEITTGIQLYLVQ